MTNRNLVRLFLAHLEDQRHCSVSTRNQRLAAIHAFARFVGGRQSRASCLVRRTDGDPVQEDSKGHAAVP